MRYGITLIGDRVAPRCIFAESVLVVVRRRNHATPAATMLLERRGLLELAKVLLQSRIDALVCGGISREERELLTGRHIDEIYNVAGSIRELLDALQTGMLHSGFGLVPREDNYPPERDDLPTLNESLDGGLSEELADCGRVDCLACRNHECLRGEICEAAKASSSHADRDSTTIRMLEASLDVANEKERTLCRLSELVYYCLEMRYQRIGLAYCTDLLEPAEIVARVFRRFFTVYPVCCKVGGIVVPDPLSGLYAEKGEILARQVACNPQGQAEVLNRVATDFNVVMGLCIGADCIFSRFSEAPVTTLFVKDKSLANNPIGAVYSDYYLKEATESTWRGAGVPLK